MKALLDMYLPQVHVILLKNICAFRFLPLFTRKYKFHTQGQNPEWTDLFYPNLSFYSYSAVPSAVHLFMYNSSNQQYDKENLTMVI